MKYQRTLFKKKIKFVLTPFLVICFIYISYQLIIFMQLSSLAQNKRGNVLLGTHERQSLFYTPNDNNQFKCITSQEVVDFRNVNDDYCDCEDGSDEPGTNACANGQFFCTTEDLLLSSNRVNDGICDCCDGSDEYRQRKLPVNLSKSQQYQLKRYLSPCDNVC